MRATRAACAAATLLVAVLAAGAVHAEHGPFTQLPQDWQRLFPAEAEVLGLGLLPIVQPPAEGGPLPFALPGTPLLTRDADAEYELAEGTVTGVLASYRLQEYSTWLADGRGLALWAAEFEVGVRHYPDEAALLADFGEAFDPAADRAVQVGDGGFLSQRAGQHEERLGARQGRYGISIRLTIAPGVYRTAVHGPLRQLTVRWAELIAARIAAIEDAAVAAAEAAALMVPVPLVDDSAVQRAVVCEGVSEQGELTGCLELFPEGTEKVALYLEIAGARLNSEIQVTWYLDGRIIGRELLLVEGDKRSLSYLYARGREALWAGSYAVAIEENGRLVGRLTFRVEGEG